MIAPAAESDVLRAMGNRRSIYSFAPRPVDEDDLILALDLAVRAPNHRLTRPWRFGVFLGEGRYRLADALGAASTRLGLPVEKARRTALLAPAVVCAGVAPQLDRPKVVEHEECYAVAAAIENLLLALHARGIGSLWTTGASADTPEVRALLGLNGPHDHIIAIVLIGYPAPDSRLISRAIDHTTFTTWHR
jgi:nitroreductase